jgi:hypothetical protein
MKFTQLVLKAKSMNIESTTHWGDLTYLQKLACKLSNKQMIIVSFKKNGIDQDVIQCSCITEAEVLNRKLSNSIFTEVSWNIVRLSTPEIIRMNLGMISVTRFIESVTGESLFSDRFLIRTTEKGYPTGIIVDQHLNVIFRCEPDELNVTERNEIKTIAA